LSAQCLEIVVDLWAAELQFFTIGWVFQLAYVVSS
jgi:hypothetical protein